jgi:hypothetical protein
MASGALAVVEQWLSAVNAVDRGALLTVTRDDVAIAGPRGVGHGKALLADWLARAGFHANPTRWFCGGDGRVVVEHQAAWSSDAAPGAETLLASSFEVRDLLVARFQRFESLRLALAATGLRAADEVFLRT